MTHIEKLKELDACDEAIHFARDFPDFQSAWDACERGDWMLWLIGKTIAGTPWSEQRRRLVCAAADCAALAPEMADPGSELARQWAIDAVKRWGMGEDNQDEVEGASSAAYTAYTADYAAAAAAYVAYAAAAYAAAYIAAAYAAYAAAYTADYAAAAAAYIAYAAAARKQVFADCAVIVRSYYPQCQI